MNEQSARSIIPIWAAEESPKRKVNVDMHDRIHLFIRNHMITILIIAAMLVEGVIVSAGTSYSVRKETEQRMAAEYAAQLEAYKRQQAEDVQKEYFLSGDASREAFVNQQIEVGARAAGATQMKLDVQKGGVVETMLARVMNSGYPDSFKEVAEQDGQIPFYSSDNKYSQHDWEIAESIIRPYYESGIVPNGLTEDFIYAEWTPNDYVLRDAWLKDSNANYLRYSS